MEAQDNNALLTSVKQNEILSYGGCDIVNQGDSVMLIATSMLAAKGQAVSVLRRIGHAKALREASAFVNGSEITSSESYQVEEITTTTNGEVKSEYNEHYYMKIIQKDKGFINGMKPVGHWFTDNKETFHYAIYKLIKL